MRRAVVVYDSAASETEGPFFSRKETSELMLATRDLGDLAVTATTWTGRESFSVIDCGAGAGASSSRIAVFPPAALKLFRKAARLPETASWRRHGVDSRAMCTPRWARSSG